MQEKEEKHPKQPWLKLYSIVLIANAIYFILFYFITQAL
jgi:hypothetical protein